MNDRSTRLIVASFALTCWVMSQLACQSQPQDQQQTPQTVTVPGLTCPAGQIKKLIGGRCTCVNNQNGLTPDDCK
ncbi:MAG: hypothetical protein HY078_16555 [Elusimicrobia bacterium]|nr:hypothetical protein [Elusimicrobiota bacterium]